MQAHERELNRLLVHAGRGDCNAGTALQRELEPNLVRIVRYALRSGDTTFALHKRILAEARQVAPGACLPGRDAPEHLIGQVARRLSDSVRTQSANPREWTLDTVLQ